MSDIDDKLKDIWYFSAESLHELEEQIASTKQAFADGGWLETFPQHRLEVLVKDIKEQIKTGPEWYSRFDRNFRVINFPYSTKSDKKLIKTITIAAYEAARKAAGLEDQDG